MPFKSPPVTVPDTPPVLQQYGIVFPEQIFVFVFVLPPPPLLPLPPPPGYTCRSFRSSTVGAAMARESMLARTKNFILTKRGVEISC